MTKRHHTIAIIPGDGIGPEVIREGVKALEKVSKKLHFPLNFVNYDVGAARYLKTKETLTDNEIADISASETFSRPA